MAYKTGETYNGAWVNDEQHGSGTFDQGGGVVYTG